MKKYIIALLFITAILVGLAYSQDNNDSNSQQNTEKLLQVLNDKTKSLSDRFDAASELAEHGRDDGYLLVYQIATGTLPEEEYIKPLPGTAEDGAAADAYDVLGALAKFNRPALDFIIKSLLDEDNRNNFVDIAIIKRLAEIGTQETIQALQTYIQNEINSVRGGSDIESLILAYYFLESSKMVKEEQLKLYKEWIERQGFNSEVFEERLKIYREHYNELFAKKNIAAISTPNKTKEKIIEKQQPKVSMSTMPSSNKVPQQRSEVETTGKLKQVVYIIAGIVILIATLFIIKKLKRPNGNLASLKF